MQAKAYNRTQLLKLLLIFNLLDGLFTLFFLGLGVAAEANPIMNFYYGIHPLIFIMVKNFLFCGGLYLISLRLHHRFAPAMIGSLAGMYLLLIAYHLVGFKFYGVPFVKESTKLVAMNFIGQ